tara:strand:+ start:112 stop:405 length:294 start_codon:yes stop_codon:yes gene_type:complete
MRSAAVALASLPPPGQSTGGKKKVNVYKGSFFYLVLRHWLATQQPPKATTQVQVVLGEAVLRRGAVAGAIRGTAIAVHRRRNTDPPAMAGQPAVGTP